jgi:ubiquinone/menaquinone biosynthesis C-methylase UbiE
MTNLNFDDEMARLQRALAQCHDMVVRRSAVLEALNLRTGEKVLELGCGGGFYAYEAGQFVGSTGHVTAIDISADQIAAARERCVELSWVECQIANATDLRLASATLDAVYGVQVLEYVTDLDKALQEVQRVLRPGGRFINLATNWSSLVWHSKNPERMRRLLGAFSAHAPFPDLPSILAAALRRAGLQPLRQRAVPILNLSYNDNCFSRWLAKIIARDAVNRGVTADDAQAWLAEFAFLEEQGEYFFCSAPVLTEAVRIS